MSGLEICAADGERADVGCAEGLEIPLLEIFGWSVAEHAEDLHVFFSQSSGSHFSKAFLQNKPSVEKNGLGLMSNAV